jgi:glycosyltransferase involved in cell wall biosynthesis
MLVGRKQAYDINIQEIPHNSIKERIIGAFTSRYGLHYIQFDTKSIVGNHPSFNEADVVNFHSLTGGYFNYRALPALVKMKPAVHTMHSMWSITGHCSHSIECTRWKTGCGKCPRLDAYPAVKRDATATEWKLKRKSYLDSKRLHIITPSNWLAELAKQSMVSHLPIHHIPNGIDLSIFQPYSKPECKRVLGLPSDKIAILFASYDLSSYMKGSDVFVAAVNNLPDNIRKNVVILLMGKFGERIEHKISGLQVYDLGFVDGDSVKSVILSAADLLAFPSRADNLPYMVQESIACGTPVAAVRVGGVPELVREGETGSLVDSHDPAQFSYAIEKLISDNESLKAMQIKCSDIASKEFSIDLQISRYIEVFKLSMA